MKNAWKNLPITGAALAIAVVLVLGLIYWLNVQDREHYLRGRNFRLLAVLARQTEQLFDTRSRIYREAIAGLNDISPRGQWNQWPSPHTGTDNNTAITELSEGEMWLAEGIEARSELATRRPRYDNRVTADGPTLQFEWFRAHSTQAQVFLKARVPAATALPAIFDPKLEQGVFDTVLLADASGRIVYVTGRRTTEIRATTLAALLTDGTGVAKLARMTSERPVDIAGVAYRMFIQPCCRTESATSEAAGFVVAGLVESRAMYEASLAISPVLVLTGVVFVIALLVGWSFFKVASIGSQQRITRFDVMQLGASGIFGLALATLLLMTTSTYARLSADVDGQLEMLANELDSRLSSEIRSAATQLQGMAARFNENLCITLPEDSTSFTPPPYSCRSFIDPWLDRRNWAAELPRAYPDFTVFALVDNSGFQRVKIAFNETTRTQVFVSERPYFAKVRSHEDLWMFDECPTGCFLESHWSWTTGRPQVVLSTATQLSNLPVAAISFPMKPLLDPVLPPSFEFAIIDQNGLVQFHSDRQRNAQENLLLETDQNPRLQSLVLTHGAGTFNTSYWGRPYRAFVRPTLVPGWSVVALHAKQPTRALVLEWATVALLMQSGYMLVWILLTLVLMSSSASWLWPDPLRRPWYRALAIVYAVALISWLIVAPRLSLDDRVLAGLLLPLAIWGLTCLVLVSRPKGVERAKAWTELYFDYKLAGALMLTITAVVPAISLCNLSSALHLEAYLKDQQISLARRMESWSCACHAGPLDCLNGKGNWRYETVFYQSDVSCVSVDKEEASTSAPPRSESWRFEDYVPYFTSASVALRGLMHRSSADGSWTSDTADGSHLTVTVRGREWKHRLSIKSPLLPVVGVTAQRPGTERGTNDAVPRRLAWTALVPLVMLVTIAFGAYWIVGYLLRRVVLVDVIEPVRKKSPIVTSPGQHAIVICEDPASLRDELKEEDDAVLALMPIVTAPNVTNAWRLARRTISDVGPLRRIVVADLDDQFDDVALMRRKLELIDELTREPDQTVLLLSKTSKKSIALSVNDAWKWSPDPERWSKVLARFAVINRRPSDMTTRASSTVSSEGWWPQLKDVIRDRVQSLRAYLAGTRPPHDWRKDLLDAEAAGCRSIEPFCRDLEGMPSFKTGLLSEDQILEELEERAGSIYRGIWQSCDENERVVIEHVARHGLASRASRRTVRRLLSRALLRKDPDLRLMNRSFQRFVLEEERRQEVVVLERQAGPSVWDRLRIPLAMAAVMAAAFLASTQREAFNATLTMAAGVTTAVPTIAKLVALLTQFSSKGADSRNA